MDGVEVWLATRRVELGADPYTLLLLANRRPGHETTDIVAGFRLYRARVGPVELWRDPQAAFEALLERYALQVRVGQLVGRFVPAAVVDPGQGVTGEEVEELFVSAFVRPLEDGRVQYAWVFALDMRSYRSSVRARRS